MLHVCKHTRQVSAYYDGELPPEERSLLEAHIAQCTTCSRELAQLRSLSRILAGAKMPDLPAAALERLYGGAVAAREHTVLRMAKMLTAAAAAIIVVCAGWLWDGSGEPETQPLAVSPWERAAVTLRDDTSSGEPQQIAQWIVEGLSLENGHDQN